MVAPRKAKDIQRIIRQAGTKTAEADLREYDRLQRSDVDCDPGLALSPDERREKLSRDRRIRYLARRLFKQAR
jgi:hypothetical protein